MRGLPSKVTLFVSSPVANRTSMEIGAGRNMRAPGAVYGELSLCVTPVHFNPHEFSIPKIETLPIIFIQETASVMPK